MTGLLQDFRYALRQFGKAPGFAAVAILVLALGIGSTTGMLAIVQSVLLRPLNYFHPERLLLLGISEEPDGRFMDTHSMVPSRVSAICSEAFANSSRSPPTTPCRFRWKPATESRYCWRRK